MISRFLERIIMEHIQLIGSLESELYFVSICSIRIRSRILDIIEKRLITLVQVIWQQHTYVLEKAPAFGFGIAVSGGVDNPAARTGDTSVIISDVVKGGPAWDKLQVISHFWEINQEIIF